MTTSDIDLYPAIAARIGDPGAYVERKLTPSGAPMESISRWAARAVVAAVEPVVEQLRAERTEAQANAKRWHEKYANAQQALRNLTQAHTDDTAATDAVIEAAKAWRWSGDTADGHRAAEAALMAAVDALPKTELASTHPETAQPSSTTEHRPAYIALVAALRSEFSAPAALEALRIQLAEHRYNATSLGTLVQAIIDAGDVTYDAGEAAHPAVRAWFSRNTPTGSEATR